MTYLLEIIVFASLIVFGFYLIAQYHQRSNLLVLGAGATAASVLREIEVGKSQYQYSILGFVQNTHDEDVISPKLRFNSEPSLTELAKRLKVKTIVLASDQKISNVWVQQLLDCKLNGIRLIDSAILLESLKVESNSFAGSAIHSAKSA